MTDTLPWWFYLATFSAGILASGHAFTSYFMRGWSAMRAIGGGIAGLAIALGCLPGMVGPPFGSAATAWRFVAAAAALGGALLVFFGYLRERAASDAR
jgi:hypothetical protein